MRLRLALPIGVASLCAGAATALAADPAPQALADERPNVIVIVTDDQDDALFSRQLMPSAFKLFRDGGTRLTNFTITTPLCCPSRATQLTGQYGHNNGVLANDPGYPALRDPTNVLPAWLRADGYRTAQVGRYLNGYKRGGSPLTPAPGWDRWVGLLDLNYRDYDLSLDGRKRTFTGMGGRSYVTRNLHRRANGIVRDLAGDDEPFYLQIDDLAPHSDHLARGPCTRSALPGPQKLRPVRDLRLPRNPAEERSVADKPSFIRRLPPIDRRSFEGVLHRMRCRAASIREVDRGIGTLVRTLRRTGELESTAIVFYSDNGYFNGEHRVTKSKGLAYEESIQVPFAIRVPDGVLPARRSRKLDLAAANIDVVPTILALTGSDPCTADGDCRRLDGRSLLPGLADPGSWPADRALLLEIDQRRSLAGGTLACTYTGVRQGDQVYVEYERVARARTRECRETDEAEHYRLRSDPHERRNLWPPDDDADRLAQDRLRATMQGLSGCAGNVHGLGPAPSATPCE